VVTWSPSGVFVLEVHFAFFGCRTTCIINIDNFQCFIDDDSPSLLEVTGSRLISFDDLCEIHFSNDTVSDTSEALKMDSVT